MVEDYNDVGYPSRHSHVCLPYISSVNSIENINNKSLIVMGSDSKIYEGSVKGDSWKMRTDLNEVAEGEDIDAISSSVLYNDNLVVGSTNGYIYTPRASNAVVKLTKPKV